MAYITANEVPDTVVCRALFIPNDPQFIANVLGAVQQLTFSYNFVSEGGISPLDMAEAYKPMFDALCFNEGPCRVIGEIIPYAGTSSPDTSWLVCDGSLISKSDYQALWNILGDTYGASTSTHFYIPDLQSRVPVGAGTGPMGMHTDVGDTFGEEFHTLLVGELAEHSHSTGNSATALAVAPGELPVLIPNIIPTTTGNTGDNDPHYNVQPSLGITYLIVAL